MTNESFALVMKENYSCVRNGFAAYLVVQVVTLLLFSEQLLQQFGVYGLYMSLVMFPFSVALFVAMVTSGLFRRGILR